MLLLLVIILLKKHDLNIDYSNKRIRYYVRNQNGADYLIVPYLFWQTGKLKGIKRKFSDYIDIDNKRYKIGIQYDNQDHIKNINDLLPQRLYRDVIATLTLYEDSKPIVENNNINNTFINGNNNQIIINQNNITDITTAIKNFINEHTHDISKLDKKSLELFLYKIKENTASKEDAKEIIDILIKFIPFTTAIISLIKSIFF